MVPEPAFAARFAPPPPPRPRPEQRRGIFFDVENTSRPQDIDRVLRYLMIDRVGIDTDFMAVGNWRVIGHDTARMLAQNGANLVHSAPSTGVRDWSDLRIAVGAGVWLAATRPGDMIDIVSDDQAFDAVGDVAASLGVQYRRLSYRSISGHVAAERTERAESSAGDSRSRRRRRGGRGRYDDRRHDDRRSPEPARYHAAPQPRPHTPPPPAAVEDDAEAHTAPHDDLIDVVRGLMVHSPGGVSLDQLANGLREHGFRRTPGSPRLITRLKRIKELEVSRNGLIRVVGDEAVTERAEPIEPPDVDVDEGENGETAEAGDVAQAEGSGEGGQRRRRRRRGGRRRRGRRGGGGNGGGGLSTAPETGGEVIAAAPPPLIDGF
jgi:hypothetical protein